MSAAVHFGVPGKISLQKVDEGIADCLLGSLRELEAQAAD
jgi:hypothetical protein